METEFTLSTPWIFFPLGQRELLSAFKKIHPGHVAVTALTKSNCSSFTLRCTEATFQAFISLVKEYISQHSGQQPDVFEEHRIEQAFGASNPPTHKQTDKKRRSPQSDHDLLGLARETDGWKPTYQDGKAFMESNPLLIKRIEELTSVQIEASKKAYDIRLEADFSESILNAIEKLNTLDSAIQHRQKQYHFPIVEGLLSPKLKLVTLEEIQDLMIQTLLDKGASQTRALRESLVISLTKDGEIISSNITLRVQDGPYLWKGHQLSLEEERKVGLSDHSALNIHKWVKDSSTAPTTDPFEPYESLSSHVVGGQTIQAPNKPQAKKVRIPRGEKAPTEVAGMVKPEATRRPTTESLQTGKELSSSINQSSHSSNNPDLLPAQPPQIRPPFIPSQQKLPGESLRPSITHYNWRSRNAPRSSAQVLIHLDEEPPDPAPKAEQNPRRKHETMNQRKPSKIVGKSNLEASVRNSTLAILSSSLACVGRLRLRVLLGRIIIDKRVVPESFRDRIFEPSQWSELFPKHDREPLPTRFLKRITSSWRDIPSILDLKVTHGKRLFEADPVLRRVTFILQCRTASKERVLLEIDESKQVRVRGADQIQGVVNWFFLGQTWDARLEVQSDKYFFGNYRKEAEDIASSMTIRSDSEAQRLRISLTTSDELFAIESVTLRRETVHKTVVYPDLLLHLTEAQNLELKTDSKSPRTYHAMLDCQFEMIQNHRLWWEVSMTSQSASSILRENEKLEIGEKAGWKPSAVLQKDVIEDLLQLSKDVIARIDHVGSGNRGPLAEQIERSTVKQSEQSRDSRLAPTSFW